MNDPFTFNIDKASLEVMNDQKDRALLSLTPKAWESQFFKRRFAEMTVDVPGVAAVAPHAFGNLLQKTTQFADEQGYRIIETTLDIRGFDLIPAIEDAGFRLVDSNITFFTRIEKSTLPRFEVQTGQIGWAEPSDLNNIIDLTVTGFVDNPRFFSRFNNRRYFSREESCAYYKAWIGNYFNDPGSLFAVWRQKGGCVGYFFYQHREPKEGCPVLKGMLAAVDRRYQNQKAHLAIQRFMFDQLEYPVFYVDNTTQFSNFAVIKNHITAQRKLSAISMVFYRERQTTLA